MKKKRKSTKSNEPTITVNALTDLFIDQTKYFEEAIVREQMISLRQKEMIAQVEFDKLDKRKREIEASEAKWRNMLYLGMTSFFTV